MPINQFDGSGYKETVLKGTEAAQHRHMFNELDRNFRPISDEDIEVMKSATSLVKASAILSKLPKYISWITMLIGSSIAAGAYLASKGFL